MQDENATFPPSEGTETTNDFTESNEETGNSNNMAPMTTTSDDIKNTSKAFKRTNFCSNPSFF